MMNRLSHTLQELDELDQLFKEGKVNSDVVRSRVAIFNQKQKAINSTINAASLIFKYGDKKIRKNIVEKISNDVEIKHIDFETQKIKKCPALKKEISRTKCLDYSGEETHLEKCVKCPEFNVTRNMILGQK